MRRGAAVAALLRQPTLPQFSTHQSVSKRLENGNFINPKRMRLALLVACTPERG